MADNFDITPGTGRTIGTDLVGGVDYQRVKVVWGPDGTVNDADVASGKSLPVQLRTSGGVEILVAHDAAYAVAPIKVGHKATTSLAGLTLVSNADVTDGFAGVDGVP